MSQTAEEPPRGERQQHRLHKRLELIKSARRLSRRAKLNVSSCFSSEIQTTGQRETFGRDVMLEKELGERKKNSKAIRFFFPPCWCSKLVTVQSLIFVQGMTLDKHRWPVARSNQCWTELLPTPFGCKEESSFHLLIYLFLFWQRRAVLRNLCSPPKAKRPPGADKHDCRTDNFSSNFSLSIYEEA